ncbi:hypothetical protein HPB47_011013 [Ixodes persulcatus]|uniref:Uncharacterized protein n=1 Tax=Ixodes persulcatus TaxID=34615 RepID=A0AC60NXM7_IXOPE|nr:hypothetical protein HPB47_011013 [Ixodes persulcatus]
MLDQEGSGASQVRAPIHGIVTYPDEDNDDELRPSVDTVESPDTLLEQEFNRRRRNFIADVQLATPGGRKPMGLGDLGSPTDHL